jgi:hypothetical protein
MSKFVVYEKVAEAIYKRVDKSTASSGTQTAINLGSGLIAGFAAALVSQPADTMLSKINKSKGAPGEGTTSRLIKIAKELGLRVSTRSYYPCFEFYADLICRVRTLVSVPVSSWSVPSPPDSSPSTVTSRRPSVCCRIFVKTFHFANMLRRCHWRR